MSLRLTPEAVADISGARVWYQRQRSGLGRELTAAVNQALAAVEERPLSFPSVEGEIRRALVRRFPYAIYYHVHDKNIIVLACVHSARDPDVWQRRVE